MDTNYWWSTLAFGIGAASGFQGVYEKYTTNTRGAILTGPGIAYVFTRGALPAACFCSAYSNHLITGKAWLQALAVGAGSELFLRSTFYVKASNSQDLLKGPLDLLRWYQRLLLDAAATGSGKRRKRFIRRNLPKVPLQELFNTVRYNAGALSDPAMRGKVTAELNKLETEFQSQSNPPQAEESIRYRLGYMLLDFGAGNFTTLVEREPAPQP